MQKNLDRFKCMLKASCLSFTGQESEKDKKCKPKKN